MQIDNITKSGKEADEFIIPAGSIFPLGCAIPNNMVLQYGAYFPPGTMVSFDNHLPTPIASFGIDSAYFPDGVLVPIHARMVGRIRAQVLSRIADDPLTGISPAASDDQTGCCNARGSLRGNLTDFDGI
jgi:hypothetical protein